MKLLKTKKGIALLASLAVAVTAAVGAYAYWTTSGSGTGTAATGSASAVTISQDSTVSDLYPGGPAQALKFTIHNPSSSKQEITSVTIAVNSSWTAQADPLKPVCNANDFSVMQPTWTAVEVVPGDTAFASTGASLQLLDSATNQDNCQNLSSIPLVYTAS